MYIKKITLDWACMHMLFQGNWISLNFHLNLNDNESLNRTIPNFWLNIISGAFFLPFTLAKDIPEPLVSADDP